MVLCNVRSQYISQEIQVGLEQIHHENANIKVCQYQVLISDSLFDETNEQRIFLKCFTGNYVLHFQYMIFNEKSFSVKFLLMGNIL